MFGPIGGLAMASGGCLRSRQPGSLRSASECAGRVPDRPGAVRRVFRCGPTFCPHDPSDLSVSDNAPAHGDLDALEHPGRDHPIEGSFVNAQGFRRSLFRADAGRFDSGGFQHRLVLFRLDKAQIDDLALSVTWGKLFFHNPL